MCLVRQQAKALSVKVDRMERRESERMFHEHLDMLFDEWLAVEHGNVWKARRDDERAETGVEGGIDARTLGADTMAELAQKILGMEDG